MSLSPNDPQVGQVKWFSPAKGYGFIAARGKDSAPDGEVFFHHSAVKDEDRLETGDRVRFELEQGPKGPAAKNVERL